MGEREFLVVERKRCEECDGTGEIATEASSWCDKLVARPTVHICYACKGTGKTLEYTSLCEALRAIGEEANDD